MNVARIAAIFLAYTILLTSFSSWGGSAATEKIVIEKQGGGSGEVFEVEIANTPEKLINGLMFRKSLPERSGMLFLFDDEAPVSFWMRNTLIPLDMLFIKSDGRISKIHHSAKPLDETSVTSGTPVIAVLEVNGGISKAFGIKEGDIVRYKAFR